MNSDNTPSHVQDDDLLQIRANVFDGQYFDINRGEIVLRDLVTQERLLPNQVPPALAADPALAEGIDYLTSRGGRRGIEVELILANHSTAQDFTQTLAHAPKVFASASPLMGIEADWAPPQDTPAPLPNEINLQLAPPSTGRGAFQHAQVEWLRRHRKTILPCEIDEQARKPLPRAMRHIWEIFETANTDTTMAPAIRTTTCNLALYIYQATRQWAILGQLGYWLWRLHGQLPTGQLTVPLMLGSWHERSINRLNTLRVPVTAHKSPNSPKGQLASYGETWMDNLLAMRADAQFIRTPRPGQK